MFCLHCGIVGGYQGVIIAKQRGIRRLEVEVDSQVIVFHVYREAGAIANRGIGMEEDFFVV